jgi:hypothetical protein
MTTKPEAKLDAVPALDDEFRNLTDDLGGEEGDVEVLVRLMLSCRVRQLLSARRDKKAAEQRYQSYREEAVQEYERYEASLAAANQRADEAFNEGVEAAASCDPWKAHLAHNPLASTLSSPGQCVEVMRKLMRELKRPTKESE